MLTEDKASLDCVFRTTSDFYGKALSDRYGGHFALAVSLDAAECR